MQNKQGSSVPDEYWVSVMPAIFRKVSFIYDQGWFGLCVLMDHTPWYCNCLASVFTKSQICVVLA